MYPSTNTFSLPDFQSHLTADEYKQLLQYSSTNGNQISKQLLQKISNTLQSWAALNNCSSYCHWFQPLTGLTAEKHDSFVGYDSRQNVVHAFSSLNLVKGEADASSLPSGSARQTFEARGYTIWDPSSQIFIRESGQSKVMCIPSVFCSYSGEILDEKTPLLKAQALVSEKCSKLLGLLGQPCSSVTSFIGPEQEYFLIDEEYFDKRIDLQQTGRTLFGAPPAKTQQMQDQYFGAIPPKVLDFMQEVDQKLSSLGIPVKTQHNEVAPHQHEIVCLHANASLSVNQNLLVMQTLEQVAQRRHMRCLLHEKPFKGVNGSGKHNNWSLMTDSGVNLFSQKQNPHFFLFFTMVMAALDRHHSLLQSSISSYQNSVRLGGHEAPPAVMSMFVGEQLIAALETLALNKLAASPQESPLLELADQIPRIPLDNSDRNRTSPFAFTGDKFEFRMPGSSQNLCFCNAILLTAFSQICAEVIEELESVQQKSSQMIVQAERQIACRLAMKHKRIIFNGNGYSQEWVLEAEKRGLLHQSSNLLQELVSCKSIELMAPILSQTEMQIRLEVAVNRFVQSGFIEANLVLQMLSQIYIPYLIKEVGQQALSLQAMDNVELLKAQSKNYQQKLNNLVDLKQQLQILLLTEPKSLELIQDAQKMHGEIREVVDWFEMQCQEWPVPKYEEMMK